MNFDESFHILNPQFELLVYLNHSAPEKLENEELVMLLKNCRTSFAKLVEAVHQISLVQGDGELLERLPALKMQAVEYCFLKISTTWDIAYQIGHLLVGKPKKKGKKYELLEEEFQEFGKHLPNLKTDWYTEVNDLRNRVVHGGTNIIAYDAEGRIAFQLYDGEVEEMVRWSRVYCEPNRPLIFAEKYFSLYTTILYNYLQDFFRYLVIRLTGDENAVITVGDDPMYMENHFKYWPILGIKRLNEVCSEMADGPGGTEMPFRGIEGTPIWE